MSLPSPSSCSDCGLPLTGGACAGCALELLLEPVPGRVDDAGLMEFGRYRLLRKIASGGMGVVWAAEDTSLRRTVALKMIRGAKFADDEEVARFTIEAKAAAGLDHPNIVPIYEVGRLEGQQFFTMKLIEGESLGERLKAEGRLPAREAALLMGRISRAVHHAHERGILHRDLKPGNILIDREGTPWLTDFGLAKVVCTESRLTLSSDHLGTPLYMSPETAGGRSKDVSTASDVWALGVILWEVLCGVPPFQGGSAVEVMQKIVQEEPGSPPGPGVAGDLIVLARRCLEKVPARRPSSALVLAEELDRWLRGEPILARRITRRERFFKWVRRKPALAALYAVLVAGVVTALVLWLRAESAVVALTKSNALLQQSMLESTATRLAGDALARVKQEPGLGLLLASESAEMTRQGRAGVLPESFAALVGTLRVAGGLDASVGGAARTPPREDWLLRGQKDERTVFFSPDSRWLITLDYATTPGWITAALFDAASEARAEPERCWVISAHQKDLLHDGCWLADSKRFLFAATDGTLVLWDAVAPDRGKLEQGPPTFPDGRAFNPPVSRKCGTISLEGEPPLDVVLCRNGGADPAAVLAVYRGTQAKGGEPKAVRRVSRLGAGFAPEAAQDLPVGHGPTGVRRDGAGRWVALPNSDDKGGVGLWDAAAGVLHILPLKHDLTGVVAFSRDGTRLALGWNDNVEVFDTTAGGAAEIMQSGRDVLRERGFKRALALSPDGEWLALGTESPVVRVVSLKRPGESRDVRVTGRTVLAVAFSPDSKWLAVSGEDRGVHAWELDGIAHAEEVVEFRGMSTAAVELAFSPDGHTLAGLGPGQFCRRWNFAGHHGGAMPVTSGRGVGETFDLAASPDGRWIATASRQLEEGTESGQVVLHNVEKRLAGRVLAKRKHRMTSVKWSQDGRWLAAVGLDGLQEVWEWPEVASDLACAAAELPAPRFSLGTEGTRIGTARHLAFHPRGLLYATCGDGVLFRWNLNAQDVPVSREQQRVHSIAYALPALAVSPDGHWLAVARHGWDTAPRPGSTQVGNMVLLFDVSSPGPAIPRAEMKGPFTLHARLAFSPDSRWLASGAMGGAGSVWDLAAADIPASEIKSPGGSHLLLGVAFAPSGEWLALGGSDGNAQLWDWTGKKSTFSFAAGNAMSAVAWLPGGRIAAGCEDGRVRIWETDLDRLLDLARKTAGRSLNSLEKKAWGVNRSEK